MNADEIQVVQISKLKESVPFTIAQSSCTESRILYTFSGSRTPRFWGIAMMFLGVVLLPGSVVMVLDPIVNPNSNYPSSFVSGLVSCLICGSLLYFGRRLIRRSRFSHQVEVDRVSGEIKLIQRKREPVIQSGGSMVLCGMLDVNSRKPKVGYWCVSLVATDCWIVLAALRSEDWAREFAEIVCEETGLQLEDQSQTHIISSVYFEDMVRTDSRALKKPMKTKPIRR